MNIYRGIKKKKRCGTHIQWNISYKKDEIMPFAAT